MYALRIPYSLLDDLQEIALPEGCTAVVLKGSTGEEEDSLTASGRSDKVTYWNHDHKPQPTDAIPRAMEWIGLARVVHAPVEAAAVAAALEEVRAKQAQGARDGQ